MSVIFNTANSFEDQQLITGTSMSFTSNAPVSGKSGVVTSSANRVLIAFLSFQDVGATSGHAMTWAGQAMTLINSVTFNTYKIFCFELHTDATIATGAQVLGASWTGSLSSATITLFGFSVSGADQTTGYQNFTSASDASGTTNNPSVTITSADGNIAVASFADDNASSFTVGGTSHSPPEVDERDLTGNYQLVYNDTSSASKQINGTLGSNKPWGVCGVDVVAVSAGGPSAGTDTATAGLTDTMKTVSVSLSIQESG